MGRHALTRFCQRPNDHRIECVSLAAAHSPFLNLTPGRSLAARHAGGACGECGAPAPRATCLRTLSRRRLPTGFGPDKPRTIGALNPTPTNERALEARARRLSGPCSFSRMPCVKHTGNPGPDATPPSRPAISNESLPTTKIVMPGFNRHAIVSALRGRDLGEADCATV